MNFEILKAMATRFFLVYIPPEHYGDTAGPFTLDYISGMYGFAVNRMDQYDEAMWFINRGWAA